MQHNAVFHLSLHCLTEYRLRSFQYPKKNLSATVKIGSRSQLKFGQGHNENWVNVNKMLSTLNHLFVWLLFNVLVNSYSHVETVSSPNHNF